LKVLYQSNRNKNLKRIIKKKIFFSDIVRSTANINLNNEKANNDLKEVTSKYPFPKENHMAAIVKVNAKYIYKFI
jgi:hypothetical protein